MQPPGWRVKEEKKDILSWPNIRRRYYHINGIMELAFRTRLERLFDNLARVLINAHSIHIFHDNGQNMALVGGGSVVKDVLNNPIAPLALKIVRNF